jgi:ParB family chromosome partitioning protein
LEALLGRSLEGGEEQPANREQQSSHNESPASVPVEGDDPRVTQSADGQRWVEVGAIDRNPYQPRTHFDEAEIADLCDSIRTHGILQPIVIRRAGDRFQLVAGERRLRAAQMAGWERAPVQLRDVSDREMAELAIVENVHRKDLNAIEKASSFQRYLQEYRCTQEELAKRVHIDRSTVANLIRLLELPAEIKRMVEEQVISAGHGRALLPIGDAQEQIEFARRIHRESLSVRATEQAVSEFIRNADGGILSVVDSDGNSRPSKLQPGQHLRDMEEKLRLALGTKVDLKQTAKGRGRMTIHFSNHEEFERLRDLMLEGTSGRPAKAEGVV